MLKISVDAAKLELLADTLYVFAKRGVPFAARTALNDTAFAAREQWVDQMGKKLVLRNKYTQRSLRVKKVSAGYNVAAMQSEVGSNLEYLATLEFGGVEQKKGEHGVPIPTPSAAGQSLRARPRTKAVRQANYLSSIHVARRVSGNRHRRNAVAIRLAAKTGGVAYLDLGRHRGLYRVTGTKRGLRIRKLYDLSKASVRTKPHPTLGPAVDAVQPRLPRIWINALKQQLRHNHVPFF
jgi:hypothetical protein